MEHKLARIPETPARLHDQTIDTSGQRPWTNLTKDAGTFCKRAEALIDGCPQVASPLILTGQDLERLLRHDCYTSVCWMKLHRR